MLQDGGTRSLALPAAFAGGWALPGLRQLPQRLPPWLQPVQREKQECDQHRQHHPRVGMMGRFKYKEVVETARRLAGAESSLWERRSSDGLEGRARFTHCCHAGEPGRGPGGGCPEGADTAGRGGNSHPGHATCRNVPQGNQGASGRQGISGLP